MIPPAVAVASRPGLLGRSEGAVGRDDLANPRGFPVGKPAKVPRGALSERRDTRAFLPPWASAMLKSNRVRPRERKPDWFPIKRYMHFDGPLKRRHAEQLVMNREAVSKHAFLPLMSFNKRDRRYRRERGKPPKITYKTRRLVYCSNRDACIFGYYADILTTPYETLVHRFGLDENVIGYRKVGSNIDLAAAAFAEIKGRGACVAFAFDISGFFDNISHTVLKRNWERVLGQKRLPDDHFAVFRALTSFSTVDRRACLRRLGYRPGSKDKDLGHPPICSIADYRMKVRGDNGLAVNLVSQWRKAFRIPQGTPLSALAANISMIDFDLSIKNDIEKIGGSYRRYSDDILIIVPVIHRQIVRPLISAALRRSTNGLRINEKKTDEVEFIPGSIAAGQMKPLQYLGFLFDGNRTLIRSNTIAKYWRRAYRAIRWAKREHKKSLSGKLAGGRQVLHKRQVFARLTHLGAENFVTSYGRNARENTDGIGVRKQLSRLSPGVSRILTSI
jgi:RNA-directed DNA polymerase